MKQIDLRNATIEDEEARKQMLTVQEQREGQITIFSMVRADKTFNPAQVQEQ